MENIKGFYDDAFSCLNEVIKDNDFYISDISEHKILNTWRLSEKKDIRIHNIVNKLFSLTDADRERYARFIIKEIRLYFNDTPAWIIEDNEGRMLIEIESEKYDALSIAWEMSTYPWEIAKAFGEFGISLPKIAEEMELPGFNHTIFIAIENKEIPDRYADKKGAKGSTTAIQVLAITTLLSELGVYSNGIDKTEIARFIQMLTNRELGTTRIQDTNIYKKYLSGTGKTDGNYEKDAAIVSRYFESLGLDNLAKKVKRVKNN